MRFGWPGGRSAASEVTARKKDFLSLLVSWGGSRRVRQATSARLGDRLLRFSPRQRERRRNDWEALEPDQSIGAARRRAARRHHLATRRDVYGRGRLRLLL